SGFSRAGYPEVSEGHTTNDSRLCGAISEEECTRRCLRRARRAGFWSQSPRFSQDNEQRNWRIGQCRGSVACESSETRARPAAGVPVTRILPAVQWTDRDSGLRKGLPVVSASLDIKSGIGSNPPDKPGLSAFMLDMLDEGTTTRSALAY